MTTFQVNFYNPFSADPHTMQTETIIAESEAVVRDVYSDVDVISIETPEAEYQPRQLCHTLTDRNPDFPYDTTPVESDMPEIDIDGVEEIEF